MTTDHDALEEGRELLLDFKKLTTFAPGTEVLPCAVQNADTGEVILVAYVNDEALKHAVKTKRAVFWSTSRAELWEKGLSSGETFQLLDVLINCEQNSLVYKVRPDNGGICHTKNAAGEARNCYYRTLDWDSWELTNSDP